MKKGRATLIAIQLLATFLYINNFDRLSQGIWVAWFVPLLLLILIILNSFWFTRFVSWVIFSGSFFSFLVLLSAFTIRWRAEAHFQSGPFYQAILMYAAFIYVSLGQIKLLGGALPPSAEGSK